MKIVRLANFVTERSGGLRTALRCLGAGYLAAGHEPVLVVPGERFADGQSEMGRVITLPGPKLPGTGGYRVLVDRRRVTALLERLGPDRLEVSDRTTLRWTGRWARQVGVPSIVVSHESLTGLAELAKVPGRRLADTVNARTAGSYDTVVCTTSWAAEEFRRVGASNLVEVPLGVDLTTFHPAQREKCIRDHYARRDEVLLVHCSRLSSEKRSDLAVATLAALRASGVPAVLVVIGDGPRRSSLERRSAGLPVRFTGFLPDRESVARLLACADVAVAPGPVETFGLAALEALACGTPTVVNAASALPEVVGDAGVAAAGTGPALSAAVHQLLSRDPARRRADARGRAERFSWPASANGFLRAHGVPSPRRCGSDQVRRIQQGSGAATRRHRFGCDPTCGTG
jgi:alpha-1,6-mannosyltransferase